MKQSFSRNALKADTDTPKQIVGVGWRSMRLHSGTDYWWETGVLRRVQQWDGDTAGEDQSPDHLITASRPGRQVNWDLSEALRVTRLHFVFLPNMFVQMQVLFLSLASHTELGLFICSAHRLNQLKNTPRTLVPDRSVSFVSGLWWKYPDEMLRLDRASPVLLP